MSNQRIIGSFEDLMERGQTSTKKASKQAASDFANAAKGQITGNQNSTAQNDQGTNEQASNQQNNMTDDQAKQFLKDLYGPSKPASNAQKGNKSSNKVMGQTVLQQVAGAFPKDPNTGKTPEEVAKLQKLRSQLHSNYYEELTNPKKPKEERTTEKLEREDEAKKLSELEEAKKKPPPLPVTVKKGTGENVVGVSG